MDTNIFQTLLLKLDDELADCMNDIETFTKSLHPDSFKKKRKLIHSARRIFGMKKASLKDLLDFWMPLWKEEGRLKGRYIVLPREEALLFGIEEDYKCDLYELCKMMCQLFA
jgi:hypothetical protein